MSEKSQLPYPTSQPPVATVKKRRHTVPFIALASILLLLGLHTSIFSISPFRSGCHHQAVHYTPEELKEAQCPVQPPTIKLGDGWNPLNDETYSALAAKRLSKAVQINTESFDNLPTNASDPLFDKHYAFSHFLETEYPKLFSEPIKHEYVNTHGHLFTWQGSNPSLKPIVLLAHIDTVPVLPATVDQWTYPPFEGKISVNASSSTPGTWIWGRGVSDCKNSVLGIYGSLERLVTEGFKPERTILVANGFDEEVSLTIVMAADFRSAVPEAPALSPR
jgi:Gly-Xaa carboxypeptidase